MAHSKFFYNKISSTLTSFFNHGRLLKINTNSGVLLDKNIQQQYIPFITRTASTSKLSKKVDIFDFFPGGIMEINNIIGKKFITSDSLASQTALLDDFLKNKTFCKEVLKEWLENLQQVNDKERGLYNTVIGMLALATKINHILLALDGSRRWAVNNNCSVSLGHQILFKRIIPNLLKHTFSYGVHTITIGCISVSNLVAREEEQLLNLIMYTQQLLEGCFKIARQLNIRITVMGGHEPIQNLNKNIQHSLRNLQEKANFVENETKHFDVHRLNLLINHDGSISLINAIRKMFFEVNDPSRICLNDLLKYTGLNNQLYQAPDIFIRTASSPTGGRIGNFFPIEMMQTHNYFTSKLAPEVDMHDIFLAAASFAHPLSTYRSRNYRVSPSV